MCNTLLNSIKIPVSFNNERQEFFVLKLNNKMYHNEEPGREIKLLEVENKFKDLDQKILNIDAKLTQIVEAILGNSLTKQGGFMKELNIMQEKLEDLEKKIAIQEEFRKKFLWTIVLVTILGSIIQFLIHLYQKIKE